MKAGFFRGAAVAIMMITGTTGVEAKEIAKAGLSDVQVKKAIIKESIAEYPGNCPCPYNTASNGSRCGRRSAYNRPSGYAPACYENDVSKQMVEEWRQSHKGQ